MGRCSECGYSWAMPTKESHHLYFGEGIALTPNVQSAAHLIGEQIESARAGDNEVREAFSHCAQCGSGHYTEYRAEPPSGTG
jgi:hypothetical protein